MWKGSAQADSLSFILYVSFVPNQLITRTATSYVPAFVSLLEDSSRLTVEGKQTNSAVSLW